MEFQRNLKHFKFWQFIYWKHGKATLRLERGPGEENLTLTYEVRGQGILQMPLNHNSSPTVGRRELILTCTLCKLDYQGQANALES